MRCNDSITAEKLKSMFNYDQETGIFTRKNGSPAGSISDQGYVRIKSHIKHIVLHGCM